MLDIAGADAPGRYQRGTRTLIPQIRKMLRESPFMEREHMRESLRARGHIGKCGFGGRRLYDALHWLEDCGEVELTPSTVRAVDLAAPRPRQPSERRQPSLRTIRRELARKREKVVERLLRGEAVKVRSTIL
ncbi:hypothetical protein [Ancylobacter amanitiformis]|uniref:Uncharacterized protein n=1 Tax=Ancylobacter amanitiformis TaxID=217069 RepID=A0ABU0LQC0_9HYPH|nr:hypothetical protein [Ancylobacter amanitiformis]MDQ0510895.1 hypothetical protein [Ancylobacter amanitiformis]